MNPTEVFNNAYSEHKNLTWEYKGLWIAKLRYEGYVAAHPNDGWVNRGDHTLHLAYPHFQDKRIEVGDKIMLGWAYEPQSWRAIEVIGFKGNMIALDDRFYICFKYLENMGD